MNTTLLLKARLFCVRKLNDVDQWRSNDVLAIARNDVVSKNTNTNKKRPSCGQSETPRKHNVYVGLTSMKY